MTRNESVRLTEGSILKPLLLFALPIFAGQLLQTLYHSVDSIVIGNFVGTDALAAVTASSPIANTLAGFFNGLSAGATVLFSQRYGAREYDKLDRALHTTMLFSVLFGAVMAAIGIVLTPRLLQLVACPPAVYEQALLYLRIYLVGILFTSMYNISASVLRSVGNSRSPFMYLLTSSILNILLDILFVAVFGMGVTGVAVATVLAQVVSVILCVIKMTKLPGEYRFKPAKMRIEPSILKQVARLGLPAGIQSCVVSIAMIFVQRYINDFGAVYIAGIGAGMRIDQFAGMPCQALGLAMTTYIGQNVGAGRYDRTHKGIGIAFAAVVIQILVLGIPMYIFAPKLARIFGSDPAVIDVCTLFLRTILPLYLFMGMNGLMGGIVRGYGYSIYAMAATLIGMVGIRQIWFTLSLRANHVITNIIMGYPIGWMCSFAFLFAFYLFHIRKKFRGDMNGRNTVD
ncbi:MAG: MATE family efflux transporter [Oscillospiraceae bacterium]|nr:MATE family efflux transporter [Oscillospiraceae bacterium]